MLGYSLCIVYCMAVEGKESLETFKREIMKVGFFEEAEGVKSSTRLNSFILLWGLLAFDGMWLYGGNEISANFLMLNGLLLVAIFAPKYIHKIVEMKLNMGKGNGNGDK